MSNRTWLWICTVIVLCYVLYFGGKALNTIFDLWTIRSLSQQVSTPAVPAWREQ